MEFLNVLLITYMLIGVLIFSYRLFSNRARNPKPVFLAKDDKHYEQLGIQKESPEDWEDGMRTNGGPGTFEDWYVDMDFEDGTKNVILFYSKDGFDVPGPAQPTVTIHIDFPDGSTASGRFSEPAGKVINASEEKCNIKIGKSYLRQIGDVYEIKVITEAVELEATMKSTIPMWRPATGHWLFGDNQEHFFAWFVGQPDSKISGNLKIDGVTKEFSGTAYHDHNWGNIALNRIINHWYWAHANAGEYKIISADIVSAAKYGYSRMPIFMVAKEGRVIAEYQDNLEIQRSNSIQHPVSGKFMDNHITFKLQENDIEYQIEYIREKDITVTKFVDDLPTLKKVLAKVIGANPTYIRNSGNVILTINETGTTKKLENAAKWNQMSLGSNKKPEELGKPSIKMDNGKLINSTMVVLLIISIVSGGLSIWSNINCWSFDCLMAAFAAPVYISFSVWGIVYSYINLFRKQTKFIGKILLFLNLTLCIVAVNWIFIRTP